MTHTPQQREAEARAMIERFDLRVLAISHRRPSAKRDELLSELASIRKDMLRSLADHQLAALPGRGDTLALCKRVFLVAHSDGWRGNQLRRDVQHVDAEKSWELYVEHGAFDKALDVILALATSAAQTGGDAVLRGAVPRWTDNEWHRLNAIIHKAIVDDAPSSLSDGQIDVLADAVTHALDDDNAKSRRAALAQAPEAFPTMPQAEGEG